MNDIILRIQRSQFVITSIIANNAGVVRSHFERVMSVADACQQRELREEAAAGRRRETEERSRMQTEDFNTNDSVIQKEMKSMHAEDENVEASAMDTEEVLEESAKRVKGA